MRERRAISHSFCYPLSVSRRAPLWVLKNTLFHPWLVHCRFSLPCPPRPPTHSGTLSAYSLPAGSSYYDNVRPLAYPDSDAVLICFDISRPETLDSVLKKVGAWANREATEGTGHDLDQGTGIMACPSAGWWVKLASLYSSPVPPTHKSVLGAGNGVWGDETGDWLSVFPYLLGCGNLGWKGWGAYPLT